MERPVSILVKVQNSFLNTCEVCTNHFEWSLVFYSSIKFCPFCIKFHTRCQRDTSNWWRQKKRVKHKLCYCDRPKFHIKMIANLMMSIMFCMLPEQQATNNFALLYMQQLFAWMTKWPRQHASYQPMKSSHNLSASTCRIQGHEKFTAWRHPWTVLPQWVRNEGVERGGCEGVWVCCFWNSGNKWLSLTGADVD